MKKKNFINIIREKETISEIAQSYGLTRQRVHFAYSEFAKELRDSEYYIFIANRIEELTIDYMVTKSDIEDIRLSFLENSEKTKNEIEDDFKLCFDLFCKDKKNHIKFLNENNFLFSREKLKNVSDAISEKIKGTSLPFCEIHKELKITKSKKLFLEMVIELPDLNDGVKLYILLVCFLEDYKKPVLKNEVLREARENGFGDRKVKNIYASNMSNIFVNLGSYIMLKYNFFKYYIKEEDKKIILKKAKEICQQENISTTDAQWLLDYLKNKIDLNFNKYELKAILCEDESFKKGIKLNIEYLGNHKKAIGIKECVQSIIKEHNLPVKSNYIRKRVENEFNRNYTKYSFTNSVLMNCEKAKRLKFGWIHSDNFEKANEILNYLYSLDSKKMVDIIIEDNNFKGLEDFSVFLNIDYNYLKNILIKENKKDTLLSKISEKLKTLELKRICDANQ